jgi:hypothetical protein
MTIIDRPTTGLPTPDAGIAEHLRRHHHRDWLDLVIYGEHHAAIHQLEHVEQSLGLLTLDHVHEPVSVAGDAG